MLPIKEDDEDGQEDPVDNERREGVRLKVAEEVADAEEPRYCRRDEPRCKKTPIDRGQGGISSRNRRTGVKHCLGEMQSLQNSCSDDDGRRKEEGKPGRGRAIHIPEHCGTDCNSTPRNPRNEREGLARPNPEAVGPGEVLERAILLAPSLSSKEHESE